VPKNTKFERSTTNTGTGSLALKVGAGFVAIRLKTIIRRIIGVAVVCAVVPMIALWHFRGPVTEQFPTYPHAPIVLSEFVFEEPLSGECHASTILELMDGSLLVAWYGGGFEGARNVKIWGSRRVAGAWSPPEVLASSPEAPCWNPVLFRDGNNTVWLFYKYGISPKSWKGAYRKSVDGRTWSAPTELPEGLLGPSKNKPITLANGDIVVGSSIEKVFYWTCWTEISSDGGRSWRKYGPIAMPWYRRGMIQPTLWEYAPGRLRMLMRSASDLRRICEATSEDGGRTWSAARPTNLPNPNAGIDAVKMNDGTVALIYNHTTRDRSPLNIAFSANNESGWQMISTLEDGPGEYSYPSVIQTKDSLLHITYTWQRRGIRHLVVDPAARWR
jgi:predicted neuraminidase